MHRTFCGEVRGNLLHQIILLKGWVKRRRKLGSLIFIDLADRTGLVQIVVPEDNPNFSQAKGLTRESVIEVTGEVIARSNPNFELPTGQWEVTVHELIVDQLADVPPLIVENETDALEDVRMKYRYLDLRRPKNQQIFRLRSEIIHTIRNYLHDLGFTEVETPILGKPTPEGARDYLVPSRLNTGHFYALPQSPQIYKQLLMVAGFERYFQVARCFRDEDLRSDRQPEFTQVDIEMSFTNEREIQDLVEQMLHKVFHQLLHIDLQIPFQRMGYDEAMNRFGSDKPDLRFKDELTDVATIFQGTNFAPFRGAMVVKAVPATNLLFTKKEHQQFLKVAQDFGAKGLGWLSWSPEGQLEGNLKNALTVEEIQAVHHHFQGQNSQPFTGTVFFMAGERMVVNKILGGIRTEIGKHLDLGPQFKFLWIVDWPLFEWNEERWVAAHHPFTSPQNQDTFDQDLANARARSYDIVLNGVEIGGGSIRITNRQVQDRMFRAIGLQEAEIQEKFGFLLEAFRYGVPPHGGLAIGIDRLLQIVMGLDSIKDCIAFPKNNQAIDMMMNAPTTVDQESLDVLHLKIK